MSPRAPDSTARRFLALDLGAESGRGILGTLEAGRVSLEEVHRFPNEPVQILGTLRWDVPTLFQEVKTAITLAAERAREAGAAGLDGIGVDTWGVDYGLLGRGGQLLSHPVHYRDPRTAGAMERVFQRISRERIFDETGLQFLELNTLFQIAVEFEERPERREQASRLLFMPDLFHYMLTGRAVSEETIASTSQMWNGRRREWSRPILEALEIPPYILPEVLPPGSVVGPLRQDVAAAAGLDRPPPVIAGACHDTGAAVAAVPAAEEATGEGEAWGYISSGTWSLMGIELPEPLITPAVLEENFTNEGGVGGTSRFLRNINGLWLVQESRRAWERAGKSLDYAELVSLARNAPPLESIVVPDDPAFFLPGEMPERIRDFCRRTGQAVPGTEGAVVRCALESLALTYLDTAARIEGITGRRISRLHVVGGGSRNELLNQLTADALGVEVTAGPAEATALGNVLMQAVATGALSSIRELRRTVRDSTGTESFEPQPETREAWRQAAEKFRTLKG